MGMNAGGAIVLVFVMLAAGILVPGRKRSVSGVLKGAGIGLLSMSLLLSLAFSAAERFGFVRDGGTAMRVFRAVVEDAAGEKPVILMAGSSHSQGIMPDVVERELEMRGYHYQVLVLATGGMGFLEQDYYIDSFLKTVTSPPTHIFLEVSNRYRNPVRDYINQSRTDRVLATSDWTRLSWAARFVAENLEAEEMWIGIGRIAEMALLRLSCTSVLNMLVRIENIDPERKFPSKRRKKRQQFLYAHVERWAGSDPSSLSSYALPENEKAWLSSFRSWQEEKFVRYGVDMHLYAPPMAQEDYEAYAEAVCALSDQGCIAMSGRMARDLLGGDVWYNATHLNREGAEIYSRWLGNAIADYLEKGKKP